MVKVINIGQSFKQISDYWSPKIAGELNNQHVKLAKLKGEFVWHKHDHEDELFWVIEGELTIELRDRTLVLNPGDFTIIPKGIEHRPVAQEECKVLLFEPATTINTGGTESDFKKDNLEWIE